MITAFLPAFFVTIAPPGASNIPLIIGSCAFAITVLVAITAFSARETFKVHLNDLGKPPSHIKK